MEYQKIAVLPTGDFAAVDDLEGVELRQVPESVWQDYIFGTGGERNVLEQSTLLPSPASLGDPIHENESRYRVVIEVTEAEYEALNQAKRRPSLLEWNDQSQGILETDLPRMFIAAIQTVDSKYEELHPADGDEVELGALSLPILMEMLGEFCMFYDNHPEVGTWWHGNEEETLALLEKYPMVRPFADRAFVAAKAEDAKYEAGFKAFLGERPEPPEFPTYVGWDGKEHAEF